uniref:Uncharacterized protein LOC104248002 n=1 Tax=Nicotiana sylvestris TaxID=4096 RepID=A0A1U7YUL6_NICSY|nr:PREDICTED: uncharacterized protein LOC104248002 [Nicotiana sylvestris]
MADQQSQAAAMRNLERQMGQFASSQNTRPIGALSNDTKANPKASINVVSLRNGRQLEEVQLKKRKQVTFNENPATILSESEKSKESEKPAEEAVAKQTPPLVQINIPLVDILQEVPKYAKYIKDVVANKRRLTEFETVALNEECGSRIQSKLPQKLKDPDSWGWIEDDLKALAHTKGVERNIGVIDPKQVKLGSRKYYRYIGSLTVPPCTQDVVWTIVRKVRTVTREQMKLIREAVHDESETNSRPVQAANKRPIRLYRPNDPKE